MHGFGLASVKEEGAPLDPFDALLCTGPGATPEWFARQCNAWFSYQRTKGISEEQLATHPYYEIWKSSTTAH